MQRNVNGDPCPSCSLPGPWKFQCNQCNVNICEYCRIRCYACGDILCHKTCSWQCRGCETESCFDCLEQITLHLDPDEPYCIECVGHMEADADLPPYDRSARGQHIRIS